jgi:CP family cyanate transporter-like MFS transporter
VLLALNLRSAITSIAPLLSELTRELDLTAAQASALGALAPILFGLTGMGTPQVVRRLGTERTALLAMSLVTAGGVARAVAPSTVAFFSGQVVALAGMGMGNVLLPPLVKRHFPQRLGAVTALYGICLQVGTALPAFAAVPLSEVAGWRGSVGAWSACSLVAAIPWVAVSRRRVAAVTEATPAPHHAMAALLRSRVAWGAAVLMGMTSLNTYCVFGWLPTILGDAGVQPERAGTLLGIYSLMSLPLAFAIPKIAVRVRNPLPLVLLGLAAYVSAYAGLALAPGQAPLVWTVLLGLAAVGFPLSLCLATLRTRTEQGAVALSGFMQGVGYLLASTGPLVTGALRSLTGGWSLSVLFLVGTLVPMVMGAMVFCRPVHLEDSLPAAPLDQPAYDPLRPTLHGGDNT